MTHTKLNSLSQLRDSLTKSMYAELAKRGEANVIAGTIGFLGAPRMILDNYLSKFGFPPLHTCILFSRPAGAEQEIHVDCSSAEELELIRCAINFPIENCDTSNMLWYQGDYTCDTAEYMGKDNIKRKYVTLNWSSEPEELDRTVIDVPTLVKVNIPHRVETIQQHRKLLTFRFKGNPDYEEVLELFKKNLLIA